VLGAIDLRGDPRLEARMASGGGCSEMLKVPFLLEVKRRPFALFGSGDLKWKKFVI